MYNIITISLNGRSVDFMSDLEIFEKLSISLIVCPDRIKEAKLYRQVGNGIEMELARGFDRW